MRRTRFLEVLAGTLALLLSSTTAFVLSSGDYSAASVMLFVVLSSLLLLTAACVLLQRIAMYNRQAALHLYQQLPTEVACRLGRYGLSKPGVDELIHLMGEHLRSQQAILDQHYHGLFSGNNLQCPEPDARVVSDSEAGWLQLRGELTALEDQFATDQQKRAPGSPSADHE